MLNRLNLQNFRSHERLNIIFTPGLNGIFGPNYSGKTTILYGILFCLGGASLISGINHVKKGTSKGFKQRLWFSCEGMDYMVQRTKTSADLTLLEKEGVVEEDLPIAAGTTAVNAKISSILGMDVKLFKKLHYAQQKRTDSLLTLGATELHKIIDQLTGIDDVNKVVDKLKKLIGVDNGVLEHLNEGFLEISPDKIDWYEANASKLVGLHKEVLEEKSRVADLKLETESLNKETKEFQKIKEANATSNVKIGAAKSFIKVNDNRIKAIKSGGDWLDYPESLSLKARIEVTKDKVKIAETAHFERKVLTENISYRSKACEEYCDNTIPELEHVRDGALDDEEAAEAEVNIFLADVDAAKQGLANHKQLNQEANVLREVVKNNICETCKRPFSKEDNMEKLKNDLANKDEELLALVSRVTAWQWDIKELALAEEHLKKTALATVEAQQGLDLNMEAQQKAQQKLEAYEASLKELTVIPDPSDLRADLDNLKDEMRAAALLTEAVVQHKEAVKQAEEEMAAIELLEYDESRHLEVDNLINALEDLPTALSTLMENTSTLSSLEAETKVVGEEIRESLAKKKEIAEHSSKLEIKTALNKFLVKNRDRFAAGIWDQFMAVASNFSSACTGGAIESIKRLPEGGFSYAEDGQEMAVKDASGAQGSIMGLAVQIALAESTSSPFRVVLADEPTADMDPEHSMATAAMLAGGSNQVIVVSHSEMDSSVCSNVIHLGA